MTSFICGIEKEIIQMNLQNRNRLTDVENKLMLPNGKQVGKGGTNYEFGISRYTKLYIK